MGGIRAGPLKKERWHSSAKSGRPCGCTAKAWSMMASSSLFGGPLHRIDMKQATGKVVTRQHALRTKATAKSRSA